MHWKLNFASVPLYLKPKNMGRDDKIGRIWEAE